MCSSVSFYKDVLAIEKQLKKLGFKVIVPKTARRMQKSGDFNVDKHKTWYKNPDDYTIKKGLITAHLKEVAKGDAILVVNNKKHEIEGYIGGNTLMEMTLAFYYKKPIYVLNPISESLSIKEEVFGMGSLFINGDLTKIRSKLKKK